MIDGYVSKQTAIDALAKAMPSLTTHDGCGESDHDIQIADEAFVDSMRIINGLPSADVVNKIDLLGWLLAYHTKSFELKGRYPSHEVISWLVNDLSMYLFEDGEQDGSID